MTARFYIDAATGQPHIYGHSVVEVEAEDILARPMEDRAGRDGSRVALGQTEAGRYFGAASNHHHGRSHEETESVPSRLERSASASDTRALRTSGRHRGRRRRRGRLPINDGDRDEDTGQARTCGEGAIGETSGELIDVEPNTYAADGAGMSCAPYLMPDVMPDRSQLGGSLGKLAESEP